jgi:hypothetical protein
MPVPCIRARRLPRDVVSGVRNDRPVQSSGVPAQSLQVRGWHVRCSDAANAADRRTPDRRDMKKYLICPRDERDGRQWLVIGHGETLASFQEREFAWNVATDLAGDLLHLTGEESLVELSDGYFTMRQLVVRPGTELPATGLAQRSSLA